MQHPAEAIPAPLALTTGKSAETFRCFDTTARDSVRRLYQLNHENQTVDLVAAKKRQFLPLRHAAMGMWEALERLQDVVDESDCDLELPQLDHALQTAEALRRDGHPRWLILTGLIHDAGKVLQLFGEPQWAVVGDTFPVGCAFSERVVHHDLFAGNPDCRRERYRTELGMYDEGCGLSSVEMAWGHDEYLYHVVRPYVPPEAAYIIRFHSFYAAHHDGCYGYLMNEYDRLMMRWVRAFSSYDLYSKDPERRNVASLSPYYRELLAEFLPPVLQW